jgi:para-nitrobenzyl esterase
LYPDYSPSQVYSAATTAARSWRAAFVEAEERAKQAGARTYDYQLDFGSPENPQIGAPHGFDIPLVFGNLATDNSLAGDGPDARAVSSMMSDAFVSFARNGVPWSEHLPEWKPYTLPNRETMVIARSPGLENDPRGAERKLFARVPYVQPGT